MWDDHLFYKCDACSDKFDDGEGTRYWCDECNDAVDKCYDCSIGQPAYEGLGPRLPGDRCPQASMHVLTVEREL
jgi:DNA-directed RNA polymerase subunit RPC12/RpoP